MAQQILQIIPTPPDSSDGIGDYALLLAAQLRQDAQLDTQFLVFRNDIEVKSAIDGFSIAHLPEHKPQALCSLIPESIRAVIVHFSGYPYFNTSLRGMVGIGIPFWLVNTLCAIKQSHRIKLIVMFHELPKLYWKQFYCFDYLNPIHCMVARPLAQTADTVLTTSTKYQSILSNWVNAPVHRLPIFSNMGEPAIVPPLIKRKRRLVIFGGSARQRVYQNSLKDLVKSCQTLGIEEIYDIGPPLQLQANYHLEGIPLIELGFQSQESISQVLLTSMVGCLDYTPFPGDLSKSGVFAAYCAHGMLPLSTRYNPSESDGLHLQQQYLTLDQDMTQVQPTELQAVASAAHQWYQDHSLRAIAQVFAQHLLDQKEDSLV